MISIFEEKVISTDGTGTARVTDTKVYDQSAADAVGALQKRWGCKTTGRAGENFVRRLYEALL